MSGFEAVVIDERVPRFDLGNIKKLLTDERYRAVDMPTRFKSMLAEIESQKEEILAAFMARYGAAPESIVMETTATPHGYTWRLYKAQTAKDFSGRFPKSVSGFYHRIEKWGA